LEAVFLHHDESLVYVYYGVMIAIVVFRLSEEAVDFWVSADPAGGEPLARSSWPWDFPFYL
jgi:hypothetical protein